MLGLNPMEQEVIDVTNNIVRNGFIYFPEFCEVILRSGSKFGTFKCLRKLNSM